MRVGESSDPQFSFLPINAAVISTTIFGSFAIFLTFTLQTALASSAFLDKLLFTPSYPGDAGDADREPALRCTVTAEPEVEVAGWAPAGVAAFPEEVFDIGVLAFTVPVKSIGRCDSDLTSRRSAVVMNIYGGGRCVTITCFECASGASGNGGGGGVVGVGGGGVERGGSGRG